MRRAKLRNVHASDTSMPAPRSLASRINRIVSMQTAGRA